MFLSTNALFGSIPPYPVKFVDKHLNDLKEEGQQLSKSPSGDPIGMTSAMKKAVEDVKKMIHKLNENHQEFMTLCQQKRDFYIVAVKYHMNIRQV